MIMFSYRMDNISFNKAHSFSSFLKSPSSIELTKELLDKDMQRLAATEADANKKKQKKSKKVNNSKVFD